MNKVRNAQVLNMLKEMEDKGTATVNGEIIAVLTDISMSIANIADSIADMNRIKGDEERRKRS